MNTFTSLFSLLIFPAGLTLIFTGMFFEWIDRKLVARFQNRVGPRWFQPFADMVKLFAKEQIIPGLAGPFMFFVLPVVAIAGALTSALYVPLIGMKPVHSFAGDLIVTIYLLSLLTMCIGLAGWNTSSRFSVIGSTRALTQMFAYEAPFLLALLGPALAAGSWQISEINSYAQSHWIVFTQPVGFIVALIGLMGKLELPPFDSPEAETEIVAGALTEYSGRGLAIFKIGQVRRADRWYHAGLRFLSGGIERDHAFPAQDTCRSTNDDSAANLADPSAHRSDRGTLVALWCNSCLGADPVDHYPERLCAMKIGTMLKDVIDSLFAKSATQLYPSETERAARSAIAALWTMIPRRAPAAVCALRIARPMPSSWLFLIALQKGMC